jgi:hypothetical protein
MRLGGIHNCLGIISTIIKLLEYTIFQYFTEECNLLLCCEPIYPVENIHLLTNLLVNGFVFYNISWIRSSTNCS